MESGPALVSDAKQRSNEGSAWQLILLWFAADCFHQSSYTMATQFVIWRALYHLGLALDLGGWTYIPGFDMTWPKWVGWTCYEGRRLGQTSVGSISRQSSWETSIARDWRKGAVEISRYNHWWVHFPRICNKAGKVTNQYVNRTLHSSTQCENHEVLWPCCWIHRVVCMWMCPLLKMSNEMHQELNCRFK